MPISEGILSRVPPQHRQKLQTALSATQTGALRAMLNGGLLRPSLDPETKQALAEAGYAQDMAGGFALTDIGRVRAAIENGQ